MMGPDYTWWHGIYEVAQHTYFKWIPELREVVHKKDGNEVRGRDARQVLQANPGP